MVHHFLAVSVGDLRFCPSHLTLAISHTLDYLTLDLSADILLDSFEFGETGNGETSRPIQIQIEVRDIQGNLKVRCHVDAHIS